MIESRSYEEEDIRVVKNNTLVPIEISVYDENGNEYPLLSSTVSFVVKKNKGDTTAQIEKTQSSGITISGNLITINGFEVTLDTGTYYYDVDVTSMAGVKTTILKGKFIVEDNL